MSLKENGRRGLSRLIVLLPMLLWSGLAAAHELTPAVADVVAADGTLTVDITLNAEALLSGIDRTQHDDSNAAAEAGAYDDFRALDAGALEEALRAAWPDLAPGLTLEADGAALEVDLATIGAAQVGDADVARDTQVTLAAPLPDGAGTLVIGWVAEYGPLVVRQQGVEAPYTGYLTNGDLSEPIPLAGGGQASAGQTFADYIVIGFEHIIPLGLDHILFVLGLFFFSTRLAPLLWQVSTFTVAHTITLALATLGLVSLPAEIVEPLIAASIVFVAIENLRGGEMGRFRLIVVFLFGLLHGLGFASVLGDIGLDPATFLVGLIGFNVGVEFGQIAVILLALLWVQLSTMGARAARLEDVEATVTDRAVMFRAMSVSVSIAIAATGAWWVVERTLL